MFSTLRRVLGQLDLEEKILNAGALMGMVGVLFPWIGGEWLGGTAVLHTGFGFYTSFLGVAIFLLNGFILFTTLSPTLGGPVILRREHRNTVQLLVGAQAVVLSIAALSVLTRVAFEFSRVEIRFGIYTSMIGSLTASLYAFLKWQEERRQAAESFFHHEESPKPEQNRVILRSPADTAGRLEGRSPDTISIPRKSEPMVLKKIEVPVVMKEVRFPSPRGGGSRRGDLIEKIKEEALTPVEPSVSPLPLPSPPPTVIPKAPAVEEHPIFRGL